MDLLLHVGTHKTGTSSIQAFMEGNRDRLLARGIHYPRSCSVYGGNHSPLCGVMAPDPRDDRWVGMPGWDAFVAECREAAAPTVVVSGEIFCNRMLDRKQAVRIRDLFLALFDSITIVVYLRRQDEFVRSLYLEAVKHGSSNQSDLGQDFEATARRLAARHGDYLHLIRILDEVFGRERLRIRVFEKGQLHPGGLLADFLETCGIAAAGLDMAAPADVNVSPGRKVITAMGLARQIYETIYRSDQGRRHREGIMGGTHAILMEAWPGDRKYIGFSLGGARSLAEHFRESNETLAREYLGRADGVLFRSERYDERAEDDTDEVPLTKGDVRFLLKAIDMSEELFGCVGPAGDEIIVVAPQLYLDRGQGYSEQDSVIRRHYTVRAGTVLFRAPCSGAVTGVRLDPAFDFCVLSIDRAQAVHTDGTAVDLRERTSNALHREGARRYFHTVDPWVVYEAAGPCSHFEFSLTYHAVGADAVRACIPFLKKRKRG